MAKPSVSGARSKQNAVLRYAVSTSPSKAANDLSVSPNALKRFLSAKPETIAKNPQRYSKILQSSPKEIAKSRNVKLVSKLSGKRLARAQERAKIELANQRLQKTVKFSQATRSRKAVKTPEGNIRYEILKSSQQKREAISRQVFKDLTGETTSTIMNDYHTGKISASETQDKLRKLYKSSGAPVRKADTFFNANK